MSTRDSSLCPMVYFHSLSHGHTRVYVLVFKDVLYLSDDQTLSIAKRALNFTQQGKTQQCIQGTAGNTDQGK